MKRLRHRQKWHKNKPSCTSYCVKGAYEMTQSQRQQERQWKTRKQTQKPHGKVKSFEELAEDAGKNRS